MWDSVVTTFREWSLLSMFLRLFLALLAGSIIGIDRGMKRRGAGIKTHVIVCLGSAIVMMTSQYMMQIYPDAADLGRMGAQVISGVGFLGVGTIIVTGRNQVKGLTTAAGLWTCACVGLAAGIGYIEGVLLCLCFVLFTFRVLNSVDYMLQKNSKVFDIYLEFYNNRSVIQFKEQLHTEGFKLAVFDLTKSKIKGEGPSAVATIEVDDKRKRPMLVEILRNIEGAKFVEEL